MQQAIEERINRFPQRVTLVIARLVSKGDVALTVEQSLRSLAIDVTLAVQLNRSMTLATLDNGKVAALVENDFNHRASNRRRSLIMTPVAYRSTSCVNLRTTPWRTFENAFVNPRSSSGCE
jgi:hypothetical protein